MDTRLKKFNDNMLVRVLAFLMCAILFVASIVTFLSVVVGMDRNGRYIDMDAILRDFSYIESTELQQEFQEQAYTLLNLVSHYKSEENIKAGKLLSTPNGEYENALEQLYYNGYYETGSQLIRATWSHSQYYDERESLAEEYDEGDFSENPELVTRFIGANQKQVEQIKNIIIKRQLREYDQIVASLDEEGGLTYFATNGTDTLTNAKNQATVADFKKHPAYMVYENGRLEKSPESNANVASWATTVDVDLEEALFSEYNDNLKIYIGFTKAYIDGKQEAYRDFDGVREQLAVAALMAVGCLIMLLYLMITTGRKDSEGKRKLYALDRIWTELQLLAICLALCAGVWTTWLGWEFNMLTSSIDGIFLLAMYSGSAVVGLWFILSVIRLFKAHSFIKMSLVYRLWQLVIYRICGKIWRSIKEIYRGSSMMKKIVLCGFAICLLSATIFLAPVVFIVIVVFAPRWVKKFESIKEGVEEVRNGNLSYKIPVEGDGELDKLAKSINEISEASGMAVKNELKNQRMKTDLISNVSHDLKTPLTSMVTYIDLLKTEGLDSENAPEYLRVLDEKTERLRHLTEDLFEAAKASSGAMPVHLEKVELLSLINQGLGEMDGRIKASELEFIINAEQEKYYVLADGQLLWRVVENLLGNVFKYAIERSRVYIDIKELKTKNEVTTSIVTLEMKNISKNPLNINADELMERFKRGDESRTTEGSGLGLAIAKDLVKLQNGWFEIFIDGDLFKAQVMLTKYEAPIDKGSVICDNPVFDSWKIKKADTP